MNMNSQSSASKVLRTSVPACLTRKHRKPLVAAIQVCFGGEPKKWLATLCLSLGMPLAHGDPTGLWTGASSASWTDGGNWVWDGLPNASINASINIASGNTPVINLGASGLANIAVIGGGADGKLEIFGTLTSADGLIGNNVGTPASTGTVTVSGATSSWTNSGNLQVGNYSTGILNIQNGGLASAAALNVGAAAGTNGTVALTGSNSRVTVSGATYIGQSGSGTLTVGAGSTVTSSGGSVVGVGAGSTGSVAVTGGTWNNGAGNLVVGSAGQGTLTISAGGQVSNAVGSIGSGASGFLSQVTVTGATSQWNNSDRLFVGVFGQGKLEVLAGATVTSADGVLARYAGATGQAVVDGAGSNWTMAGHLRVGGDTTDVANPGGTGTLDIKAGGAVSSGSGFIGDSQNAVGTATVNAASWTMTGRLAVGNYGKGTLVVENGGTVQSADGLIGWRTGSTGSSALVTGTGSQWTLSDHLYVGNQGQGSLSVAAGGKVSTVGLYAGTDAGASGSVTLSGTGSTLEASDVAYIGFGGNGTASVGSGSSLTSHGGVIGNLAGSTGTVTINGGSWNNGSNNLMVGNSGQGSLTINNGGSVSNKVGTIGAAAGAPASQVTVTGSGSTWNNSDRLFVGTSGIGKLEVLAGATVNSADGVLARYAGATGNATVSGAGSAWKMGGDLRVGGDVSDAATPGGNGTLNIAAGGAVTSNAGYIGDSLNSTGTVTLNAASWTLAGRLGVGNFGKGSLVLENGGTLNSGAGLIGWNAASTGNSVLVSGAGSRWNLTDHLYVGNLGQGTLTITGGGVVSNVDGFVGTIGGAGRSEATVSGAGSHWENRGDLLVAQSGGAEGKLTVSDGGKVTSVQTILGDLAGTRGSATLSGAGTTLQASGDFNVGRFGNGSLSVSQGAVLSSNRAYIANEAGSSGDAVVSGPDSQWNVAGTLHVGSRGDGSLLLNNGGRIAAGNLAIAFGAGSKGTLSVGAVEGQAAAAAGEIRANKITLGAGAGTLVLNHTSPDYLLAAALAGSGNIKVLGGTTLLTADSSAFSGVTRIADGAGLALGSGAALGGNVNVDSGGNLTAASSRVGGNLSNAGLLTLPKGETSYSKLTVGGDFSQADSGVLRIGAYATGKGQFSQLAISGKASLGGVLEVDVASGSPLVPGNRLRPVIQATGGVQNRFTSVTDNSTLFNLKPVYGANYVDLLLVAESDSGVSGALQGLGNSQAGQAGRVLDGIISRDPGSALALMFVPLTSNAQVVQAVSQSLPLLTGNNVLVSQTVLANVGQLVQNRLNVMTGLAAGDSQLADRHFWLKPFGSRIDQADGNGSSGYRASTAGLAFGMDGLLTDIDRVGLAMAYADAGVESNSTVAPHHARAKVYQLIGYGSRNLAPGTELSWQLDAGLNNNWGTRNILFAGLAARSRFDTYTAHAGMRLTRNLALSERTDLAPSVGLDYVWLRNGGYLETGAGALNLQVNRQSVEQLLVSGDARFTHRLDNGVNLLANLGLAYDLRDQQAAVVAAYAGAPGAYFLTRGVESDPWILRAGIGVSTLTATGLEFQGRLDAEHRQGFNNRSASVNLRWAF